MKKRKVKTHTFRRGKYHFDWLDRKLEGMCEIPENPSRLYMMIPEGGTCKDLCVCIHEMAHAEKIPDTLLDGERDSAKAIGTALYRMGWRKK